MSRHYHFVEGERVLCYEPDPTKAKVLYDSKVLGIESRDRRGRKVIQYKIHFQGWNSSWDRRVSPDFILKDTEDNRQLQKDLAKKAQLQLAAYLYRRERKKKKDTENSGKMRSRVLSDDGNSFSNFDRDFMDYQDDCDTESYSSSIDSMIEDDRVFFNIKDKLRQYLDEDFEMIVKKKKLHILPANITVVNILENFVKQNAIKLFGYNNDNSRRRTSNLRSEKREKELEKFSSKISLLKELVDGLRLYFDFTLKDYLLYKEEKEQAHLILSMEKNVDKKSTTPCWKEDESFQVFEFKEIHQQQVNKTEISNQDNDTNNLRYKLRYHEKDDPVPNKKSLISKPQNESKSNFVGIPNKQIQNSGLLEKTLSWQMTSNNSVEPSTIFGPTHLARMLVKLPDFLNACNIPNDKLKMVLVHMDSFVTYFESHKEFFGIHNYKD